MRQKTVLLILIAGLSASSGLAHRKWPTESAILKVRQKEELQSLRLKQKYAKSSLEDSNLPKAVRLQLKHEMKRERRKLLQRQKDEREALRDRERLLKLEMKQLQSE
jgi:hypothetical protein